MKDVRSHEINKDKQAMYNQQQYKIHLKILVFHLMIKLNQKRMFILIYFTALKLD